MPELAITWPAARNEHGDPMLWVGSWLIGGDGVEGAGIYSGRGGERRAYAVPADATGLRIRRWPNEGLEPEYADVLDLGAARELQPEQLNFDTRQPFSRLDV